MVHLGHYPGSGLSRVKKWSGDKGGSVETYPAAINVVRSAYRPDSHAGDSREHVDEFCCVFGELVGLNCLSKNRCSCEGCEGEVF